MKKATQTKRTVTRIALALVISLVLGVGIYTVNAKSLNGNTLPMPFGVGVAVVLSGSMEPELQINDMIIVTAQDSYQVGDVVVYQSYGTLIVHRIISMDGETVITQGDANGTPDPAIKISDIKGEVVASIPFVGVILSFIRSPLGIILILGAAFLLMERSFRKEKQESLEELEQIKDEIRRLQAEQQEPPQD